MLFSQDIFILMRKNHKNCKISVYFTPMCNSDLIIYNKYNFFKYVKRKYIKNFICKSFVSDNLS